MHKLTFALLALVAGTQVAGAATLRCIDSGTSARYLLITAEANPVAATEATLIGFNDVAGTYSPVRGLTGVRSDATSASLYFSEATSIDWAQLPAERCFVFRTSYNVLNLRRNNTEAAGDYLAEIRFVPEPKFRPGVLHCPTPRPAVAPPRPLTCSNVTLSLTPSR